MLTRLSGGKVYDPAHGVNGEVRDIFIRDGRIVAPPPGGVKAGQDYELSGSVVMAGGIDIHTHIGGGKMTIARMLLPEDHAAHPVASGRITRSGSGLATPSTITTGYRYAEMGHNEARARENQNPQNELLEAQDGKRLDTRTTSTTVGADPALETVGTVNGAENDGR